MKDLNKVSQEEEESSAKSPEHITDIIGEYGCFQRTIALIISGLWGFAAFQDLAFPFFAPFEDVKYECAPGAATQGYVGTFEDEVTKLPVSDVDQKCLCDKWVYNTSYQATIITEWDLVCDRKWLASTAQSIYRIGLLVASFLGSRLGDLYGRKRVFQVGLVLQIAATISAVFSHSINQFIVTRFFIALGDSLNGLNGWAIFMEMIGSEARSFWGVAANFFWCFGYMILPLIAYYVRNFRYLMLISCMPHIIILLPSIFWIPESPRWLMVKGRFSQAKKIIKRAAKVNRRYDNHFDENLEQVCNHVRRVTQSEHDSHKEGALIRLFKSKTLRRYLFILYFISFNQSLLYYGLSLNAAEFGGDLYLGFFLSGLAELPSNIFCIFAVKYFGRRSLASGHFFGAGLTMILYMWVGNSNLITLRLIMSMIGKFMINGAWTIMFIFMSEVFPTVLRTTGMGTCSAAGLIGSALAPYLGNFAEYISMTSIFALLGVLSICNGLLVIVYLPETKSKDIADTIDETEMMETNCAASEKKS